MKLIVAFRNFANASGLKNIERQRRIAVGTEVDKPVKG
jgi:hypothetical protein